MTFSGPMFERSESEWDRSVHGQNGAHYNVFECRKNKGIEYIRLFFPEGECDEMNLITFSTSGVHGSYLTIEDIEKSLIKYQGKQFNYDNVPEDYADPCLTFLIIHPRLVCMRYGNISVSLEDIPYLKKLRESARKAFMLIGEPNE